MEKRLLILTSRLTIGLDEKEEISKIVDEGNINWFEFFKLAAYHKVLSLSWKNINKICRSFSFPKYINDTLMYIYNCSVNRNLKNEEELRSLIQKCEENGVICVPVKGSYLIPNLYAEYGVRYSGDMDILIRHKDIPMIQMIMQEMGYVQGYYDLKNQNIVPLSRGEQIKWKLYMSNLAPYIRKSEDPLFPYYKIDFRYALDDNLNTDSVDEIIDETRKKGYTRNGHYLIHLCTHFYNEVKHTASIANLKDLNIIKLCDMREFVLKYIDAKEVENVIEFAYKYNLKEAVYYSMFALQQVYNDGYEQEIINKLDIQSTDFLNTYGDSTLDDSKQFNKNFMERLFSCGNSDELTEVPKLFRDV